MKKNILLILNIVLIHSLSAQNNRVEEKRSWFDLQATQHIGLSEWSSADYANDGFPTTALTEFRGVCNFYIAHPHIGGFIDMGVGIMPAPGMRDLSLNRLPMPYNGTQYYLREVLSKSGNGNTSAHFKMTFGLFGNIPASEKLAIMPYFGIGFITMPQRKYEVILKEDGSNMQYQAVYSWNYKDTDGYADPSPLGYLTGRLNFKYKLSEKSSLLLGLEYTWFIDTLDFYGKYTNTFNENIQREFSVKGDNMNMLGISVGISL
ncbi:MAG: hypothetical protein FWD60_02195 [Candidatus Azobacteroides sp.]|nr:hypothetical protein [Candidatus Azobacteroides sp.]